MLFSFVNLTTYQNNLYAMSLDDDEEDSEDVQDLLDKAKLQASKGNYSKAKSIIKEARKYGVDTDDVQEIYSDVDKKHKAYLAELQRQRVAREKREREERQRAEAQERYNQSGNKGGSLSCSRVASNYGLYRYCTTGNCDSLASNYEVYRLCKDDEYSSLPYGVYTYLSTQIPTKS